MHRTGGAQRTDLLLRALQGCGPVDLLLVTPPGMCSEGDLRALRDLGLLRGAVMWRTDYWAGVFRPLSRLPGRAGATTRELAVQAGRYAPDPAAAELVRSHLVSTRYDVVVGRSLQATVRAGLLRAGSPPVVLDRDDLDSERLRLQLLEEGGANPGGAVRLSHAVRVAHLRGIVRAAQRRAAHVWMAAEEDLPTAPTGRRSLLPNVPWRPAGVQPPAACPPNPESQRILFVGTLNVWVNRHGLDRFLETVWPVVRRAAPDTSLQVVGAFLDEETGRRWAAVPGVIVSGQLDELRPAYAAAAFAIAPMELGSGTKIKVLEALDHGRTCVASPHALRGLGRLVARGAAWPAGRPEAWADACIRLLRDPGQRQRMAETGHRIVREQFTIERFTSEVERTVEDVRRRARRRG